jgi:hypothetical protein
VKKYFKNNINAIHSHFFSFFGQNKSLDFLLCSASVCIKLLSKQQAVKQNYVGGRISGKRKVAAETIVAR